MSWVEELAVSVVIGILNEVIKSPKAKADYLTVLQHIQADVNEAIQAIQTATQAPPASGTGS